MFNDANGEHMFVYAKLEPFLPALRTTSGNPDYLANLEKVVKDVPNVEEKLANIRQRVAMMVKLWQERTAKAAMAAEA